MPEGPSLRFTIQNAAIPPRPAWPVLPNVESKLTNTLSQYREPRGGPGCDARIFRSPARRRSPGGARRARHFVFVHIHPNLDGNGRTGRFLMNVTMAAGGY